MATVREFRYIIGRLLDHLDAEGHNPRKPCQNCRTCKDMSAAYNLIQIPDASVPYSCPYGCGSSGPEHICYPEVPPTMEEKIAFRRSLKNISDWAEKLRQENAYLRGNQ